MRTRGLRLDDRQGDGGGGGAVPGPIPVYFLILPDTLLLDLAGFAEAFRVADKMAGGTLFAARFVGPEAHLRSSIGLVLSDIGALPAVLEDNAWIIICGLTDPERALKGLIVQDAVRWLKGVVRPGHTVCCVCAGALVAAAAGLLDGRQCTSHHEHTDWLRRAHPAARVQENRLYVQDGNLYTSAGVTSGIDLALALIAEKAGPLLAVRVARDLVVYMRRTGSDPQISSWLAHRNHLHPVVHRAQDELTRDPQRAWTLPEIARAAHVSVRTLSRLFKDEAGVTPLDYLAHIRVTIARERLTTTRWSVERVAESAGFSSALQLRRSAKRLGGLGAATPRLVRDKPV